MDKEKQNEKIPPEWLFKETFESKNKKMYNPKPLKQKAKETIKIDDNE